MRIIILALALISYATYGQERFIVVHSPFEQTADTIPFIEIDATIERDKTDYYIGNYNNEVIELPQVPATEGLYEKSHFTRRKKASDVYDINNYPIRTSVKLFSMYEGKLYYICSGSLVGDNFVLTAAHCVSEIDENFLKGDSIFVAPVFNNGDYSNKFEPSYVNKIFFLKDWRLGDTDLALLQLEKNIGKSTGWLSIGFDRVDSSFQDGIFFKFSYPGTKGYDSTENYNGSDLYFYYGLSDDVSTYNYGAKGTYGILGESGSSLIKIKNKLEYTTYGALSFAAHLRHSRMDNEIFYTFKSILEDDFITDVADISTPNGYSIYPNPSSNSIRINSQQLYAQGIATLIDSQGRELNKISNFNSNDDIDISYLSTGLYYLRIENGNRTQILNFIKH